MEKINNKKGSASIESLFIIPSIIIFIMIFIIIMLISYEKTVQVISVHRQVIKGEVEDFSVVSETEISKDKNNYSTESSYKISNEVKKIKYEYKDKYLEVSVVQEIIELIFYLVDEYEERLKVIKNNAE